MITAHVAQLIFALFFAAEFILERTLALLNAGYVRAHAGECPEFLNAETHRKAVAYTLARNRFGHVSAAVDALLKLAFLFSGLLPWLGMESTALVSNSYFQALLFFAAFTILSAIAGTPLDLYSTFVLEAKFGFNKTTFRTWLIDRIKGAVLGAIIGVPFVLAILWLTLNTGPLWWLWAALFVIAFQFLMLVLYPTFISPLFNKFTPLQEGDLKISLHDLAQKCGFAVGGIFVMDGSTRSGHSNAYFTGLGSSRRIVIYDTLVAQLSIPELTAVLAHEIGHYKLKHIPKGLLLSCVLTVAGFYALSLVLRWPVLYETFGPGPWAAGSYTPLGIAQGFLICSLISGPLSFWTGPLFNAMSRKYEYQADAYAASQTSREPMRGALLKLHQENLSNPTPHPLFSAYHYSHPALAERLRALA